MIVLYGGDNDGKGKEKKYGGPVTIVARVDKGKELPTLVRVAQLHSFCF
jgi:hypothetical protein